MRLLRGFWGEFLIVLVIILGLCLRAHCAATAAGKRHEGLGMVTITRNPNIYLYGFIIDGQIFEQDGKTGTSLRMQPAHTPMLYDESLLFCGNQSAAFAGKRGSLVLTYRWEAHETIRGVGCHALISVDEVKEVHHP